jgi:hypothetical protein
MRCSPTFGYTGWIAAIFVGLVLVGCAASNGEDGAPPTTELPAQEKKADNKQAPPKFEATIPGDSKKQDGTADNQDPAPPDSDQCIDNGDPGSSASLGTELPPTDDCDENMKTLTGIMKGAVDVDFYKLSASDLGVSVGHPFGCSLGTDFEAETAGTELCVFMRCKNSTVDAVTGCAQGAPAEGEAGMKGCCAAAPGHAVPTWDCSGFGDDDSADIQIRVRQPNGNKCLPYKVNYRF